MSEVEMVTVSSRGQISIPADLRREMEIDEGTKLLVVSEGDNILLRKVDESTVKDSFEDILKPMWGKAEEEGLDEEDAESLVHESRGVEG
ncbi:AbrB/MazE/SpoVT family DNA-binding domain-containing protein [Haladaptatus sp. F3-133]|jgi:AbrB family looped-hinge helix DNA binding protein|uniref:AbrB/MazE/SpoVT family DNA-binding domain-containing protein n=1 Tax=Halorutilus salinus TaxID=2487751 RepID=A0A9Q4C505_9EURY|nr:AbrB/MazE/SpoVT family DNA-binding domain-containing protein [Halorutilus salinus]MCX2819175.1 AbrB/MazE/SpoVT family DNA-binding domain-containing protein [Halorutilus salinus]